MVHNKVLETWNGEVLTLAYQYCSKKQLSLMVVSTVLFFMVGLSVLGYFNHRKQQLYTNVMGNFYEKIVWVNNPENLTVLVNKNYRLPEEYEPEDLVLLEVPLYQRDINNEANYLRKPAADALKQLFIVAKSYGHDLTARSGYRSYVTQVALYDRYVVTDGGEAADTYSARAGHSEHQTGLAIDITSDSVNNQLTVDFGETEEGKWVAENAHRFGFVIRYPQERVLETGYQYEPWHLRYVGIDVATEIYENSWILEEYILENNLIDSL